MGEDSAIEEAESNTIPPSWQKAVEESLKLEKPAVVMVMGGTDSGKTSICTFLANSALKAKRKTAIIDADLGQSDIGPPTTVGLAYTSMPLKDLFHLEAEAVCFVGFTSPGGAEDRVAFCIGDFKQIAIDSGADFVVINTDGWIDGEKAVEYKVLLAKKIAPDILVGIERGEELKPLLSRLDKKAVQIVESPSAIQKRDREKRKALRELGYKKHLKNAKVEAFPLSWIRIEGIHSSPKLFISNERLKRIGEVLGVQPIFCEETVEALWIVLKHSKSLDLEGLVRSEEVFKKKVRLAREGDEKGLIVGLHNVEDRFLGLGVLYGIDYKRKIMKISTPVSQDINSIRIGNVRLDKAYREVGANTLWASR